MRFRIIVLSLLWAVNVFGAFSCQAQNAGDISVAEFAKKIGEQDVQVLDVRTSNEYNQNHLKGAFLADWTNRPQFVERVSALDKAKPVYTYCLSGARSAAAAKWLRENGYTAYNMSGGIAAWKQTGKPLEEAAEMPQMSLQQYQALIPTDKTTLVDVSAVWCPPCKKMKPIVDSLATGGKFELVTIDGGEQTSISNQLGIEAFPTFIVYKNGKEVWRKSGIVSADELSKQLH